MPTVRRRKVVIGGLKSYDTSTELKRLGLTGTLQFKPHRTFTSTVDGFYSNFKDDQIKRGVEVPLHWGGAMAAKSYSPAFDRADGLMTSGTLQRLSRASSATSLQPRHAKLYSFGWNNALDGDNGWHGFLDISYSKTNRNELSLRNLCRHRLCCSGPTDRSDLRDER